MSVDGVDEKDMLGKRHTLPLAQGRYDVFKKKFEEEKAENIRKAAENWKKIVA